MVAALAVIVLLGVVLLVLPGLIVDHDLAGGNLAAADRLNAVNNVRTTLLQTVGGEEGNISDKLDVGIGGIYALWRLADHSGRDREAVVSIMAAYLRTHLPWPPQEPAVLLGAVERPVGAESCGLSTQSAPEPRTPTPAPLQGVSLTQLATVTGRLPPSLDAARTTSLVAL
ncbi:hypothetical protein ABZ915_45690 [Streptomyces sp. NPDC046915]|uniref:hypothetical protein n=1 Tax=Streptomyces sp. NPDC046915 TaxID=3155257 RepID=UPI0033E23E04